MLGRWADPLPETAAGWSGGLIVSYLSRWIVPPRCSRGRRSRSLPPGPPGIPGLRLQQFRDLRGRARIWRDLPPHGAARVYRCHRRGAALSGARLGNAGTLLARAYDFQLVLFYGVLGRIIRGEALPVSSETWARPPFTRKQFSELGRLTAGMTEQEIAKRKRALDVAALKPAP